MDTVSDALIRTELFSGLDPDTFLPSMLSFGSLQDYPKGSFCILPQQLVDRLGVVISGRLHLTHIFSDGSYSLMGVLEVGDLLGADLVFTRTRRAPYYVESAVDTQVFSFPISALEQPGAFPEALRLLLQRRMLTLISHENMKKEYRLAILSRKRLRERIVSYLSMQAGRLQTKHFTIPFSREEMASFLCVNRSALSHELSLMQQEGLLRFCKNEFTLLDWKIDSL